MNHINKIRKELNLQSTSQTAWSDLTHRERYVFIRMARLTKSASRLLKPDFDNFHHQHKVKITLAIHKAANLALKFKAHLVPTSTNGRKELRAA